MISERDVLILSLLPRCEAAKVLFVQSHTVHEGIVEEQDIMAWAILGAINAVDTWHDGDMPLGAYAWWKINQAIIDELRRVIGRDPDKAKVDIPFSSAGMDVYANVERTSGQWMWQACHWEGHIEDDVESDDTLAKLPALLAEVKVKPRHIRWFMRFIGGESQMDIADDEGVNSSTVSCAIKTARRRLMPYRLDLIG